jgi:adenine-specific DNA-methyltransferase
VIKYLGSKRLLVPQIVSLVGGVSGVRTVVDLFSGTSRVGHALKREGLRVRANDHNAYAATLARCYVQADRDDVLRDAERWIAELSALPPAPGWFTRRFSEEARYFHPKNAARIEAIRARIAALALPPELEAVLLVSLMEAADRVDSTTGVQMAYLKSWAPRAHNDLALRMPDVLPRAAAGKGEAHALDASEAARTLSGDVAYVDPPYNQHSYLGNYHVWETLVRWDAPETFGVANKRLDVKERKSAFNRRHAIAPAIADVLAHLDARVIVLSFSDEGFVSRDEIEALCAQRGRVRVIERDHPRYVGARIGIYNPKGEKVGKISHVRNKELLFLIE